MFLVEWLIVSCGIFQVVVYHTVLLQSLLICWFCGLSLRALIIWGLILSWTRVSQLPYFLGMSFWPLCGERALPKCHCGNKNTGESSIPSGKPDPEALSKDSQRFILTLWVQVGECCQWVSGPGLLWGLPGVFFLSKTSVQEGSRKRRLFLALTGHVVSCLCGHGPSPVKALLLFNKLRLNKLTFTQEGRLVFLCADSHGVL